jgi:RecA-family ATPase
MNQHIKQTPRPTAFQGDLANLPAALEPLKAMPNWVCWRWVWKVNKHGEGKWTKPPYQPKNPGAYARNNDPATWGTYEEALAVYQRGECDGIGFNLMGTDIDAFDLDKCRDPVTGEIRPEAMAIVNRAESYTEFSVSGTGLRIIGRGSTGRDVHRKQKIPNSPVEVESYRNATRYIVVSGNPLPGAWPHLENIGAVMDEVVAELEAQTGNAHSQEDANVFDFAEAREQRKAGDDFDADAASLQFKWMRLHPELQNLILRPPGLDRSTEFHHAVCWLGDAGCSAAVIEALIVGKPIAEKYVGRDLRQEIERCLGKAKPKQDAGGEQRSTGAETAPPPTLSVINPVDWEGRAVPEREWIVRDMIPAGTVSMLLGDGGDGKSTLILQLAVARAIGRDWIGTLPSEGRTLVLSAEDDHDELHRRVDAIRQHYGASFKDLGGLRLVDLVGEDAVLGELVKGGRICATALFDAVVKYISEFRPDFVIIDALADAFAGDEINRSQARQFIGLLKKPAREYGCAFLCLAHPSISGMNTGNGTSGSTGWSNSVRSRLYLEKPKPENVGDEVDPALRLLSVKKTNYGPPGHLVRLRWKAGVFVPEGGMSSLDKAAMKQRAEMVFMDLLRTFNEQGQNVSPASGCNYAPKVFAGHDKGKGIPNARKLFKEVMQDLLDRKIIKIEMVGPASRQTKRLVPYADG